MKIIKLNLLFVITIFTLLITYTTYSYKNQIENLREEVWLEQEWAIDHWRTYFREISYYNEDNLLIMEVAQILVNDIWKDTRKTLFNYDINKLLIKKETYSFNETDWELTDSIIYKYNSQGKVIENIQRLKIEDYWTDYLKYNFYYDENNNDTLEIKWKFINDHWEYFYKIHKQWENNKKTQTIQYMIFNENWEPKTKNVYSYNNLDLLDKIITYAWINYDWMYSSRIVFLYDEKNRQIEQIYQLPTDTGWESQQSYATIYDSDGNEAVLITYQWRNGVKEGYQRSIRESYLTVDNRNSSENDIFIYPNPAKNEFTIVSEIEFDKVNINIINLLGIEIEKDYYSIIKNNNKLIINIRNLANGLYFVKIESNKKQVYKPLLISE